MSADSNGWRPTDEPELLERSLDFLCQARPIRDLRPSQVERIRRRLLAAPSPWYRISRWPAWAALALLLFAGGALAAAQVDLRSLPLVGSLFETKAEPTEPQTKKLQRRSDLRKAASREVEPATSGVVAPEATPAALAPLQPVPTPATDAIRSEPVVGKNTSPADEPPRLAKVSSPRTSAPRAAPSPVQTRSASNPRAADLLRHSTGSSPAVDNPIVLESRSLAAVAQRWRHAHDARLALASLDDHDRRYPNGAMRMEATILRAEVYLALGLQSDALAVLDGMGLSGIPRARELRTVRGELRVRAGRCREARQDLGAVLESSVADPLAKRAVQALAHCPM